MLREADGRSDARPQFRRDREDVPYLRAGPAKGHLPRGSMT
jgi:hypothetical protein